MPIDKESDPTNEIQSWYKSKRLRRSHNNNTLTW
jgi:hypothetical protein